MPFAGDGSGSSGGGDLYKADFEAAWFIGDQPINYCIEMADDFPIERERVSTTIQAVISQWKDYVVRKDIEKGAKVKLNFNYHYTEQCSPETELTFYFGVDNPRVRKAKTSFSDPIAFAWKESYDFESGMGKGLVWVKTDPSDNQLFGNQYPNLHPWRTNNSFYRILLHEFGHIFGVPHVPHTIMDDNLPNWLFADANSLAPKTIDMVVELAMPLSPSLKYVGIPAMSDKNSKEIFQFLTGKKKSAGKIESIFEMDTESARVTLKDRLGSYVFELTLTPGSIGLSYPAFEIFKKAYLDDSMRFSKVPYKKTSHVSGGRSFTLVGKLITPQGTSFTALVEYNLTKLPQMGDIDENGDRIERLGLSLNFNPKYANIPYEVYIIKDHKKVRIFGPSAYYKSWWWGPDFRSLRIRI